MTKTRVVLALVALLALSKGGLGRTQEGDATWPIGAWTGTSPSPKGGMQAWEVILERDYSFKGLIDSRGDGIVGMSGTWTVSKAGLSMTGTWSSGPPSVRGTSFTMDLAKKGDLLEGTQRRTFQPREIPVSLRKIRYNPDPKH